MTLVESGTLSKSAIKFVGDAGVLVKLCWEDTLPCSESPDDSEVNGELAI